jgi:transcriptional regulator with XRE-family HTH domain|tara:strand:- start:373 stop:711 length:339 start_codon:yes stop_codon:yes gene_type:complete
MANPTPNTTASRTSPSPETLALARTLWDRRKELLLSREDLAELSGVSRSMVRRIEQGDVFNPGLDNINRLLAVLGLTLEVSKRPGWKPAALIQEKADRKRATNSKAGDRGKG